MTHCIHQYNNINSCCLLCNICCFLFYVTSLIFGIQWLLFHCKRNPVNVESCHSNAAGNDCDATQTVYKVKQTTMEELVGNSVFDFYNMANRKLSTELR